jgi:RiboL-PSP-HEPN
MARADIDVILNRVEALALEIESFVPLNNKNIQFRADLAGLLVVAIAASYESCVKETLVNYASRHHGKFAVFAQNHYSKLSSRVRLSDLHKYASTCDGAIQYRFGQLIKSRKTKIVNRVGKDFTKSYDQILDWRHDFAHEGLRNTTVEEALSTHTFGKRVMYAFNDAFE